MRFFRIAFLAVLLAPGIAHAGGATLVARDVPLGGSRALAVSQAPIRFNLVGLHWQGSGTVFFRTRSLTGRWSAWRPAAPEPEDLPDRRSPEAARAGRWRLGNPYWTGASERIQYQLSGEVRRLRAYFVWSPVERTVTRRLSLAGSPPIIPRLSWGANEAIRRASPRYADRLRYAIVHHTAGSSTYTPAQSVAIVLGIELYHVQGNGWNDIGYNFLVDKYGQVFEGRFGGIARNVIGAHALGFNRESVGVAVIGNYESEAISDAARRALVTVLAWRLDLAHVDPLSFVPVLSGGNSRFPAGAPVALRAISGHRDTGFTDCPGNALYAQLPSIAHAVVAAGLPKLYAASASGAVGGLVRFQARLSSALPWRLSVADAHGQTVATGSGGGPFVDWTWDTTKAPPEIGPGPYTWTIDAGPTVRSASGLLAGNLQPPALPLPPILPPPPAEEPPPVEGPPPILPPPLGLSGVAADPATVNPDGHGQGDETTISYTLAAPAAVTATVVDQNQATVATLFSESQPAGLQSFTWSADGLPDGPYTLVLSARSPEGTQSAVASVPVLVDRTLAALGVAPATFSPNGDRRLDTTTLSFTLANPAEVEVTVQQNGTPVATVFSGQLQSGPQQLTWDGTLDGTPLPDGEYQAVVSATDALSTVTLMQPLTIDTSPPQLELVSLSHLLFRVSEPAIVTLQIDGARVVKVEPAGVFHVPHLGSVQTLRAVAWDPAGNASPPISGSAGGAEQAARL